MIIYKNLRINKTIYIIAVLILLISIFSFSNTHSKNIINEKEELEKECSRVSHLIDAQIGDKVNKIRVGTYNLLSDSVGFEGIDASLRSGGACKAINNMKLDILGVQELSRNWYNSLNFDLNLKPLSPYKTLILGEMTAIYYNPKTLDILSEGSECFTEGDDKRLRRMAWGIFATKGDNKKFGVLNCHLNLSKDDNLIALCQSMQIINKVNYLNEKFNCPIFIIGDFNAKENTNDLDCSTPVYQVLESKFIDTKIIAKGKIWGNLKSPKSTFNDHIFLWDSKNIKIENFIVFSQDVFRKISDHFLIFVEVQI